MRLIQLALLSLIAAGAAHATDEQTAQDPPRITGLESISFAENSPSPVATYVARDAQDDPIAWSLAGRDAGAFTFTTDTDRSGRAGGGAAGGCQANARREYSPLSIPSRRLAVLAKSDVYKRCP